MLFLMLISILHVSVLNFGFKILFWGHFSEKITSLKVNFIQDTNKCGLLLLLYERNPRLDLFCNGILNGEFRGGSKQRSVKCQQKEEKIDGITEIAHKT